MLHILGQPFSHSPSSKRTGLTWEDLLLFMGREELEEELGGEGSYLCHSLSIRGDSWQPGGPAVPWETIQHAPYLQDLGHGRVLPSLPTSDEFNKGATVKIWCSLLDEPDLLL